MKQMFISFVTTIAYTLIGLMLICLMFVFTAQAAEYDIYDNYGQSSKYEIRTDSNSKDFTINDKHTGQEVGTFSVPKSNNSCTGCDVIYPGKNGALELRLPSINDLVNMK